MDIEEIKGSLCFYNKNNPDYIKETKKKDKKCFCDNCFYGRNELAKEILMLREKLRGKALWI